VSTALRNPQVRLLLASRVVNTVGDALTLLVLPLLLLHLDYGPESLALSFIANIFPRALIPLLGGALADAYSPLRMLLYARISMSVFTLLFAGFVYESLVQLWMIYSLSFTSGLIAAFTQPALASVVPRVVHRDLVVQATSILRATAAIVAALIPTAAGIAIGSLTSQIESTVYAASFAFDGLTFIVSCWLLQLAHKSAGVLPPTPVTSTSLKMLARGLGESYQYLRSNPMFSRLYDFGCISGLTIVGVTTVAPALIASDFGAITSTEAPVLGYMYTAIEVGSIAGIIAASVTRHHPASTVVLLASVTRSAVLVLGGFLVTSLGAVLIMFFVIGLSTSLSVTRGLAHMQRNTSEQQLGRVIGMFVAGQALLSIPSIWLVGKLALLFSTSEILIFFGFCSASCALTMLNIPRGPQAACSNSREEEFT